MTLTHPPDLEQSRGPADADLPRTQTPQSAGPVGDRRALGGVTAGDMVDLGGAALSAVCTSLLLFGRIAPLSGILGFVVVTYVLFLAIYALVLSMDDDRPAVVDKVMAVVLSTGAAVALLALTTVIVFTLVKGREALVRTNIFTQDMSLAGPADPLTVGGIEHAIIGTLIIITISVLVVVPLGLSCAVFLNETRSPFARPVRTIVDAMTALPSILAGLFIFATWILVIGFERSGLAASLAVGIMMLPIVIRSADVVLRLVPGSLREASAALGAPLWRTVWFVVLPTARSGLATAVILGIARGVGETAPVLLTSGFTASLNVNPLKGPMVSLPFAAFEFVRSPQPTMVARGFATAAVLMVLVLVLFAAARFVGGRPAGQVTRRQAARRAARSARDAARFEAAHVTTAARPVAHEEARP